MSSKSFKVVYLGSAVLVILSLGGCRSSQAVSSADDRKAFMGDASKMPADVKEQVAKAKAAGGNSVPKTPASTVTRP